MISLDMFFFPSYLFFFQVGMVVKMVVVKMVVVVEGGRAGG